MTEEDKPPVSQSQFAWASLGIVGSLFLFLAAGNLTGVQVAALTMSGVRATSWYYYSKPIDLIFAIAYLGLVASWVAMV